MESEIWAAFTLTGDDLDPDTVTAVTQLTPSDTWRKGDPFGRAGVMRHERSGWSMKSSLPLDRELEDHIRNVLDGLRPRWSSVVPLTEIYATEIECVVKSYGGDRPALHIDAEVLKSIADLNAALDIDLYVFGRRRRKTSAIAAQQPR